MAARETNHSIDWRKTAAEIDAEFTGLALRNDRLCSALRLVMSCAGEIDAASDAALEDALECGDQETERQANAWLVARKALRPNVC